MALSEIAELAEELQKAVSYDDRTGGSSSVIAGLEEFGSPQPSLAPTNPDIGRQASGNTDVWKQVEQWVADMGAPKAGGATAVADRGSTRDAGGASAFDTDMGDGPEAKLMSVPRPTMLGRGDRDTKLDSGGDKKTQLAPEGSRPEFTGDSGRDSLVLLEEMRNFLERIADAVEADEGGAGSAPAKKKEPVVTPGEKARNAAMVFFGAMNKG